MKTLLVTGASSGIGRALAVRAARAGYAVFAVGRDTDALAALRAKIEAEDGVISVDASDITLPGAARAIVARTLERFGSIDVLVNNAGFVSVGPLAAQSDDELQRQFGTHVVAPVALVREALDALRRAHGHVFMLGSGVARVPIGGLGAYPPAKAAIRSATAILRRELRVVGVGVTYVDPGAVDTPFMTRAGMPGAPRTMLVSPEEVARKILVAVAKRPRVVNAVGWQTTAVAFAERFPRLTDALLERAPGLIGGAEVLAAPTLPAPAEEPPALAVPSDSTIVPKPASETAVEPTSETEVEPTSEKPLEPTAGPPPPISMAASARTVEADGEPRSGFAIALDPLRRRMEKLNLRESFVRELLVPGATLDLGDIALRWAGMPNKNERAITEDVLEALAAAGFLARADDNSYRVVIAP